MLCICIAMQQFPYPFYVLGRNGFHQTNPFTLSEGLSEHSNFSAGIETHAVETTIKIVLQPFDNLVKLLVKSLKPRTSSFINNHFSIGLSYPSILFSLFFPI